MGVTSFRYSCLVTLIVLALGSCSGAAPKADDPEKVDSVDATGTYSAKIPYDAFADVPGDTLRSYAGKWTLTLDAEQSTYRIEGDEDGFSRVSGFFSNDGDSAIFNDEPAPTGAFNCFIDGERTVTEGKATYSAEWGEGYVVFTAEEEPCPLREAVLSRRWTRV